MKFLALIFVMVAPRMSHAHPGHGPDIDGMGHYFTSPSHYLPIVVLVTIMIWSLRSRKSKKKSHA